MIDIEQLLRVPFADIEGGFDLSLDGTHLAFAWNLTGQWEIYELNLNGSDKPRPVSSPKGISVGPGGKFAPRYSPDASEGRYLRFCSSLPASLMWADASPLWAATIRAVAPQ